MEKKWRRKPIAFNWRHDIPQPERGNIFKSSPEAREPCVTVIGPIP